jgi:uncharacterized membrane protein YesL
MRNLLNPDSPAMRFLTRIGYAMFLNALWFFSCIPLVTVGASTTALYSVMQKVVRDEEAGITRSFFRAFRDNFRQATVIWLLLAAFGAFLGFDAYILFHLRTGSAGAFWTVLTAALAVLAVFWLVELLYVFPLLARFENTTPALMRNAVITGFHFLLVTVLVAAVHFVMGYLIIFVYTPLMFLGEGLCALISAWLMNGIFLQLEERAMAESGSPGEEHAMAESGSTGEDLR